MEDVFINFASLAPSLCYTALLQVSCHSRVWQVHFMVRRSGVAVKFCIANKFMKGHLLLRLENKRTWLSSPVWKDWYIFCWEMHTCTNKWKRTGEQLSSHNHCWPRP